MYDDTSPEMYQAYIERLRSESLLQRAQAFDALCRDGRRMGLIGLRLRFPGESDEKLRLRMFVEDYGRELAERAYGPLPADLQ